MPKQATCNRQSNIRPCIEVHILHTVAQPKQETTATWPQPLVHFCMNVVCENEQLFELHQGPVCQCKHHRRDSRHQHLC